MSIYVETYIQGNMDDVWLKTQTPCLHEKWDLRFSSIEYLAQEDQSQPQRFRYKTRIGFGLQIVGEGETVGTKNEAEGSRTSALKFWSDDPKSLIEKGAGYWQYRVEKGGICFLTSYDYQVRFGRIGRTFDAIAFRPILGWATAWSFDRLRLWIEKNVDPASSLRFAAMHCIATLITASVWIYQGFVPKLLFQDQGELAMLTDAGIQSATAANWLMALGWCEIAIGGLLAAFSNARWPFVLTIVLMIAAIAGVVMNSPDRLWRAFNPVSLNLLMIGLAVTGLTCIGSFPTASRCLRKCAEKRS